MIRNFRSQDWICFIDLDKETNTVSLKETVARKIKNFARGFYINLNGNLIGIAATPDGPLLFTSRGAFLLEEGDYLFKLTRNRLNNTFSFCWRGCTRLEQHYTRALSDERKGWSDDRLVDFFAWLTVVGKRKNFHSFYTTSDPLIDDHCDSYDLVVPLNPIFQPSEGGGGEDGQQES